MNVKSLRTNSFYMTGMRYVEAVINSNESDSLMAVGLDTGSEVYVAPTKRVFGAINPSVTAISYSNNGLIHKDGVVVATVTPYVQGSVVQILADLDTNQVHFWLDNVHQYSDTLYNANTYVAVSLSEKGQSVTFNLKESHEFSYDIPAGYTPWSGQLSDICPFVYSDGDAFSSHSDIQSFTTFTNESIGIYYGELEHDQTSDLQLSTATSEKVITTIASNAYQDTQLIPAVGDNVYAFEFEVDVSQTEGAEWVVWVSLLAGKGMQSAPINQVKEAAGGLVNQVVIAVSGSDSEGISIAYSAIASHLPGSGQEPLRSVLDISPETVANTPSFRVGIEYDQITQTVICRNNLGTNPVTIPAFSDGAYSGQTVFRDFTTDLEFVDVHTLAGFTSNQTGVTVGRIGLRHFTLASDFILAYSTDAVDSCGSDTPFEDASGFCTQDNVVTYPDLEYFVDNPGSGDNPMTIYPDEARVTYEVTGQEWNMHRAGIFYPNKIPAWNGNRAIEFKITQWTNASEWYPGEIYFLINDSLSIFLIPHEEFGEVGLYADKLEQFTVTTGHNNLPPSPIVLGIMINGDTGRVDMYVNGVLELQGLVNDPNRLLTYEAQVRRYQEVADPLLPANFEMFMYSDGRDHTYTYGADEDWNANCIPQEGKIDAVLYPTVEVSDPHTGVDPYYDNVVVLLRFKKTDPTGRLIIDEIEGNEWRTLEARKSAVVTSVGAISGGMSLDTALLTGSRGTCLLSDPTAANLGNNASGLLNFTVEMEYLQRSGGIADGITFKRRPLGTGYGEGLPLGSPGWEWATQSNRLLPWLRIKGTDNYYNFGSILEGDYDPAFEMFRDVKYHVAMTLEDLNDGFLTGRIFVNGIKRVDKTIPMPTDLVDPVSNFLGFGGGFFRFNGFIDNVRITNGVCRYVNDFDHLSIPYEKE